MAHAIDTTQNCTSHIVALQAAGIDTAIRYYSRSDWKRIRAAEAVALGTAGIRLVAIYQNRQDRAEDFSEAQGRVAAGHAHDYASQTIFQPAGSAIYFAADFDPSESIVTHNIKPYLKGVNDVFKERAAGGPAYKVGLYSSGRALRLAKEAGLAEYLWLSQSTGFAEYRTFEASRDWHLRQLSATFIAGLSCDPDDINPDKPDIGAFSVTAATLGPAMAPMSDNIASERFVTLARHGLRLRSGPGIEFDAAGSLPLGTTVFVIGRHGEWAAIDVDGNRAIDGFVHISLLRPA